MTAGPAAPSAGAFYAELGIWMRVGRPAFPQPRAALFLDRDGVIVEEPGYLCRAADLVLIPGAAEIIALANRRGIPVVEITNQAGIGRGYYSWEAFAEVETALTRELAAAGACIDAVLACPYHQQGVPPWNQPRHPARKPRPGMLLAIAPVLNLDLKRSWIVGDKTADLLAGYHAGLRGGLHVLTGHGPSHREALLNHDLAGFDLRLGNSIRDAQPVLPLLAASGPSGPRNSTE